MQIFVGKLNIQLVKVVSEQTEMFSLVCSFCGQGVIK